MKITLNENEVKKAITEYMNKNFSSHDYDIEVLGFDSTMCVDVGVCKVQYKPAAMVNPGYAAPVVAPQPEKEEPVW